jgi:NosR/NirI family nitrous oxide reductase transcriptional regulator
MARVADTIICAANGTSQRSERGLPGRSSHDSVARSEILHGPQCLRTCCGLEGRAPIATQVARAFSILLLAFTLLPFISQAGPDQDMRFPAPEFKSGYVFPETTVPPATSETQQWVDVAVLAAALSLAAWLAVKRHSRRGVFWLMIFSLFYFGFYKQGCICPIGSIQNVALSLFNSHYALPSTVLIFFALPLLFALFFGRVFCASVCALGAVQDLVAIHPLQLPRKVTAGLSVIPYAYLGLAVLLAATNTGFLICRYDPFIGFFRLTGNAPYLYLGAGFLLAGVFIARPYCRFFCPYGALLGLMSRFSRWHLTITPTNCVNCRLCENSCPFDYIHKPNLGLVRENRQTGVRRLGYLFVMLPVLVALCGWVGHRLSVPLSRYNSTVALAEQALAEKQDAALEPTLETKTFRSKGTTENELIKSALVIRSQMNLGGWLVGGFIGLVFGLKLIGFSTVRTQKDYEVDRTHCFSCARCCTYCPNDSGYKPNFSIATSDHPARTPSPEAPLNLFSGARPSRPQRQRFAMSLGTSPTRWQRSNVLRPGWPRAAKPKPQTPVPEVAGQT